MYLGIDCGTQGTKALVLTKDGQVLGQGHAVHRLIERDNGAREQDPRWWVAAMVTAVRQALDRASVAGNQIRALGISGQQHGLVALDETGAPIRPAKLWNDTETAPENAELVARLGGPAAWFKKFGIIPLTGYTISKLEWLRQNEPENFARISKILLPHDYLNFWLTGVAAAECGDASGTGFFDVRRRDWAEEALALIDGGSSHLAKALPRLVGADAVIGPLTAQAARELGLSERCLVAAGGGDNMMGAIGTGNVREGLVTMSIGTSATVYSWSARPVLDPEGLVAPFCASSGGWLPLVCTMNATNVTGPVAAMLNRDVAYIAEALRESAPGAGGMTMLPFLNGERTPDLPTAKASLHGITGANLTAANLMRAAVEGVSFGLLSGLSRILASRPAERIILIGGGARNTEWCRLLADASGAEIVLPQGDEAGCLGGAIQAIWAHGAQTGASETIEDIAARCVALDETRTARPEPARQAAYQEAFARYRERLMAVHEVGA